MASLNKLICIWITLIATLTPIRSRLKSHIAPIRPPLIEENHNKDRILFSFDPECARSRRSVRRYIESLLSLFPCLSETNRKIYERNGDYHTYLSLHYDNDNRHNLNESCLDHSSIDWDDFCLYFVDFEVSFEVAEHHGSVQCNTDPSISSFNEQYLWHLDYIDGAIDGEYHCIDSSSEYRNVDIFVLDTSIQSAHSEFEGVTLLQLDPSLHEDVPLTLHGTHVAAIAVGKNVGITQGSPSIPLYEYPICRKSFGCAFSFIEDALERIITFIQDADDEHSATNSIMERVVINLSVQTKGLPSSTWVSYLDSLFEQIVDLGGIIVASAGNKNIDACQSFPGMSQHTISVAAYGEDLEIYGNTGHCVDLYAPGIDIYSANLGGNDGYKQLKGTSMSAPMITGLIANMLWVNPDLTLQEIRNHLEASYHGWKVREEDEAKCQDNGCHLVHWDCDSYQVELLDYEFNLDLDHDDSDLDSPSTSSTTTTTVRFDIDLDDGSSTTSSTTSIPTGRPTKEPSNAPTTGPTSYPTYEPTGPTAHPTQEPTDRPSRGSLPVEFTPTHPTGRPIESEHSEPDDPNEGVVDNDNIQCLLPDDAKPCGCFKGFLSCTVTRGCVWDMMDRKCEELTTTEEPTGKPTERPSIKVVAESTMRIDVDEEEDDLLCCNAMKNKDNAICKPMVGQSQCATNSRCYWDETRCLEEACFGRKTKCKKNQDCCSGICLRFRGISHCT